MKKLLFFMTILISLFACKKKSIEEIVYKDELKENVVLIKEETKSKIIKLNGNTLIVKGTNGYARTIQSTQDFLKIGTVLVCEPLPNIAPDGILGTVIDIQPNTDVQYGAGYNNVTLAPASLEDWIQNTKGNDINSDKQTFLTEEVVDESGVSHTVNSTSVSLTINKQIKQNFGSQSSVNFKISGSIKFEKDIRFGMKVRNSKIENFKFEIVNKDVANVKLDGDFELATNKEWQLCKIKGKSIRFMIGNIPVWVKPIFTVKFKVDASGKAAFTFDIIKFEKEYTNGIEYSNRQWNKIDIQPPTTFLPLQYQLYLEGKAKLNLEASLEGSFYNGLLSFGVNGSLFRKLENRAQLGQPTKCDWILGAEVGVFVKSSFFSKDLLELNYTGFSWAFDTSIIDLLTSPPINIPTADLVAYYPFNGNANDLSGNNNNGTTSGGIIYANDRFNVPNKACSFNGSDAYIVVPPSLTINSITKTTDATFTCWFKTDSWNNIGGHISKNNNSNDLHYRFLVNETSTLLQVEQPYEYARYPALQVNQWYHFAAVKSGNIAKFYINGNLVNSTPMIDDFWASDFNTNLEIGRDAHGPIEYTRGVFDEIRIYKRALTSAEINAIKNN